MLQENRRKQLDDIVRKMIDNKESDSNIQFVVKDFSQKYAGETANIQNQPTQPQQSFANKIIGGVKNVFGNVMTDLKKPATLTNTLLPERQVQAAGEIAGGINKVIGAGLNYTGGKINSVLPQSIKNPIKDTVTNALQSHIGQEGINAIKGGMDMYNGWKQKNPNAAKDLESVVNIAALLPIGKAGEVAGNVAKTAVNDTVKPLVKTAIKPITDNFAERAATQTAKEFDNIAGRITQGDIKDIPIAQKALSNIDISGVKNYKDLISTVDGKIGTIANKLDNVLATDTLPRPINVLKSGGHNYVSDALDQLKTFYQKINDVPKTQKINSLISKANTEGLTVLDMNNIAKLHGQDLNAFNANGELASGLTKQAAENTRSGVKTTAKNLFNNPVYNAADKEMANLIRTKKLLIDVGDKVNELNQKILPRTLGEKAGRLFSQVVNTIGMNSPKGAVEYFLGRGTGLKTLNALDLERTLQKNLQNLQKLANPNLSDNQLMKELENIAKTIPPKMLQLPAPAIRQGMTDATKMVTRNALPMDYAQTSRKLLPSGGNIIYQSTKDATKSFTLSPGWTTEQKTAISKFVNNLTKGKNVLNLKK